MRNKQILIGVLALALAGCSRAGSVDVSGLKPIETHKVGNVNVVLLSKTGELKQGQNDFVLQFQNEQGQPVDVGQVQLGSSMSMPSMAPMSGQSELTPTRQPGTYRVKSNFRMSGAWHFDFVWDGPAGRGHTAFNSNVR